jgi:hypothetical protein
VKLVLTVLTLGLQDRLGGVGERVKSVVHFLTPKQEVSSSSSSSILHGMVVKPALCFLFCQVARLQQ